MAKQDFGAREQLIAFGPFQLHRSRRELFEGNRSIRLGSRALDLLVALVERAGEVVGKQDLIAYAWPRMQVDEVNLRVHMAALRKMLGDGQGGIRYIANVSGRGYCFVAPVNRISASPFTENLPVRADLPAPLTRAVGREEDVTAIAAHVRHCRMVTVAGPGGVGKSTVALAVGERLIDEFADGAYFVDLATVEDRTEAPSVLAAALGISTANEYLGQTLISFLAGKRLLIILDNCEHVVDEVAQLAERILRDAPGTTILATTREPLRTESEYSYRLQPLRVPPESPDLDAATAMGFSAVQLFAERALNRLDSFEITDRNAHAVAEICRRLDGLPLAVEIAASCVDLFGLEGISAQLDGRILGLARGRRTTRPRHQSLRSTLDWSFSTLPSADQVILRRLAVFRGLFSVESATAVVSDAKISERDVLDGIMSLVGKSLLVADLSGQSTLFRLLHVTRAYAAEKLNANQERASISRRHAQHFRSLLGTVRADWEMRSRTEWLALHGHMIYDIRAALDWAFSSDGDLEIGASLTAASITYGIHLSLINEFTKRAQVALRSLAQLSTPQPHIERNLQLALALAHFRNLSPPVLVSESLARAMELSQSLGSPIYQVEPLIFGLIFRIENGEYREAATRTEDLVSVARSTEDPMANLQADRVGAQTHHWAGDRARARMLAERVMRHPALAIPLIYSNTSVDKRVAMGVVMARILWLEGYPDQAEQSVAEALELAPSAGPLALAQCLALGNCPIAFWRGDMASAKTHVSRLLEHTTRFSFARWQMLGVCYDAAIARRESGADSLAREVVSALLPEPACALQRDEISTVADWWIDEPTVARARSQEHWGSPEILRRAALLALQGNPGGADEVEISLTKALEIARAQGALAWELRVTMDLARLWQRERRAAASAALTRVYERFCEGHATADLADARALLEQIGSESTGAEP